MSKRALERFFLFKFEPTRDEINGMLNNIETLAEQINIKVDAHILPGRALANLRETFAKIKQDYKVSGNSIDDSTWKSMSEDKHATLYWEVSAVRKALLGMRGADLIIGTTALVLAVATLAASVLWYVDVHEQAPAQQASTISNVQGLTDKLRTALKQIELDVDDQARQAGAGGNNEQWNIAQETFDQLKNTMTPLKLSEAMAETLDKLGKSIETRNFTLAEERTAQLQEHLRAIAKRLIKTLIADVQTSLAALDLALKGAPNPDKTEKWQKVLSGYKAVKTSLLELDLTVDAHRQLATLGANIDEKKRDDALTVLAELRTRIDAIIEDLRNTYFYTDQPGKWFEIAAWAWFGVLVGAIFYMAKQLKLGTFDRQDVPSILGECFIAPVVTCVIFFLFASTGITEFDPSRGSILIILGFSFVFGYAIRRTVGLLENIKQRLLPNP